MITAMAASAFISVGTVPTYGASEAARYVASQIGAGRERLHQSSLGLRQKGVFEDLGRIVDECGQPNWDGYGATPVANETYQLACRFLEALPLGTPAPTVGAEPDGHLTLEWHRSPRRTLSVSISPKAELHFAALLPGPSRDYGTRPFIGGVPARILELIHRNHANVTGWPADKPSQKILAQEIAADAGKALLPPRTSGDRPLPG